MSTADVCRRSIACGAVLLGMLAPRIANAGDKALAESLFQEGRKLVEQKQYEKACAKFAASEAQDPSPGTLLNLGKCNESLGKTATAWATYKEAEALARNLSRTEQEKVSAERAAALEPKLSHLRLDPPKTMVKGLVIERSGSVLSPETLGVDAPIDPGTYEIKASAPGYETWTASVTLGTAADRKTVAIGELQPSASNAPPVAETHAVATADAATTAEPGNSRQIIGWTLTGVGGALVIGGGVMGLMTLSQASNAENDPTLCPAKQCTPAGREEIDGARTKATFANIGVGVGVAALAAGVIVLVTGSSKSEGATARATTIVPVVGKEAAGISVLRSF